MMRRARRARQPFVVRTSAKGPSILRRANVRRVRQPFKRLVLIKDIRGEQVLACNLEFTPLTIKPVSLDIARRLATEMDACKYERETDLQDVQLRIAHFEALASSQIALERLCCSDAMKAAFSVPSLASTTMSDRRE